MKNNFSKIKKSEKSVIFVYFTYSKMTGFNKRKSHIGSPLQMPFWLKNI